MDEQNLNSKPIPQVELLSHLYALYKQYKYQPEYYNKPEKLQKEILGNPEEYKSLVEIYKNKHIFKGDDKTLFYNHLNEQEWNFFDVINAVPAEKLDQIIKSNDGKLESLFYSAIASSDDLTKTRSPKIQIDENKRLVAANRSRDHEPSLFSFGRDIADTVSTVNDFSYSSMEADNLRPFIRDNFLNIITPFATFTFLDPEKAPDLKMMVNPEPNSETSTTEYPIRKNGNKFEVNTAREGKEESWLELKTDANTGRSFLLIPRYESEEAKEPSYSAYYTVSIPEKLDGLKKVAVTFNSEYEVKFADYTAEEKPVIAQIKSDYSKFNQNLQESVGKELEEFGRTNTVAVSKAKESRLQLVNELIQKEVDGYGEKFNDFKLKDEILQDYKKGFGQNSELFEYMHKIYQTMPKFRNEEINQKMIDGVLEKYFDPKSQDYLLNDVPSHIRDRLQKVLDITKDYKTTYPQFSEKDFFEMLHQIDYELKDKMINTQENMYRWPLNGSRCPSCDEKFKEMVDELLRDNNLIVGVDRKEVLDAVLKHSEKDLSKYGNISEEKLLQNLQKNKGVELT